MVVSRKISSQLCFLVQYGRLHRSTSFSSKTSNIRFNFHKEVEKGINQQINEELAAAYTYFNMATVFGRDSVALPGFHKLFYTFASEEVNHAKRWVDFLNLRGGLVEFKALAAVTEIDWTPLCAICKAINMETNMTRNIEKLRELTEKYHDYHSAKFIDDDFLIEQYKDMKELADLKTQIERVGDDVGLYILDRNLLQNCEK